MHQIPIRFWVLSVECVRVSHPEVFEVDRSDNIQEVAVDVEKHVSAVGTGEEQFTNRL